MPYVPILSSSGQPLPAEVAEAPPIVSQPGKWNESDWLSRNYIYTQNTAVVRIEEGDILSLSLE